ncbi:YjbF family lipoprotein [Halomonas sp. M5N1S17]|uniref:YjbF family lipoprotein n=1 Tax=Halomonas alkalisoli TaxID=2907158 RepID=UPI001F37CC65|nr:YjbF family lipoprotein [Halomonas alkalisoli]MCE9662478.1 YjbF family lipoprotein [Halomonas alkalisoli]
MGETVLGFWQSPDLSSQAAALPYASLAVKSEGNEALMVMAHSAGERGRDTFWQAGDYATLHLRDGIPMSTMGFERTLLGRWIDGEPGSDHYLVHAHWQDAAGQEYQDVATASLTCETAQSMDLPLTVLALERCVERLEWQGGTRSRGELWREPVSLRIWGGDMALWPDGQRVTWQVARPWWSVEPPAPKTSD